MTPKLQIGLRENQTAFLSGAEIHGAALWELESVPKSVELRLLWFTRGKGTTDTNLVETIRFDDPLEGDTRTFSLRLPESPYSFSGKLISVVWALELVVKPGRNFQQLELTMAPGAREVLLPRDVSFKPLRKSFMGT